MVTQSHNENLSIAFVLNDLPSSAVVKLDET
jgi:hypothetical protein